MRLQSLGVQDFIQAAETSVRSSAAKVVSQKNLQAQKEYSSLRSSRLNENQKMALDVREANRSPHSQVSLKSLSRRLVVLGRPSLDHILQDIDKDPARLYQSHSEIDRRDAYALLKN